MILAAEYRGGVCRTNWAMRQRVEQITAEVRGGSTSVREAARQMRAELVPVTVAARVLGGMEMSARMLMQAELDIDRMPHESMESDRYMNALDAHAEMILEDLVSRPENVGEALTEWSGHLTYAELNEFSALLREKNAAEIGRIVINRVRCYWRARANGQAIDVMANACQACMGRGCRHCEREE